MVQFKASAKSQREHDEISLGRYGINKMIHRAHSVLTINVQSYTINSYVMEVRKIGILSDVCHRWRWSIGGCTSEWNGGRWKSRSVGGDSWDYRSHKNTQICHTTTSSTSIVHLLNCDNATTCW